MTKQQIRRQSTLFLDFNTRVIRDSELQDQIPFRSRIIITDHADPVFTKQMVSRAQSIKRGPVLEVFKQGRKWMVRRMKRINGTWQ